jgi:vacuolar-type H+-ATPase subunit I/STV1
VLLVTLKRRNFDEKNITMLSKLIPQNILFILEYEDSCKLAIYHTKLMQTQWRLDDQYSIELKGIDLDKVWENIVAQIGGITIADNNTLDEQIQLDESRQKLEKEIAKLEKLARSEKQPRKKFELVQQLRKLEFELRRMASGKNN